MPTYSVPKYPTSSYYQAVREIFYSPEYVNSREYKNASRYATTRRIVDKDTRDVYHESCNKYKFEESTADTYYTVDILTENRLDVISSMAYGNPTNWWIIAMCNNIIDPFDIPIGTTLRIPPVTSLYSNGGVFNNG